MAKETDILLADKIQTQIHKSTIEGSPQNHVSDLFRSIYKYFLISHSSGTFATFKTSKKGLTTEDAKEKRKKYGLNIIPPPLSAPEWLCCLLPCLLKTPSMMAFHECVPQHGFIKRNDKWVKMDRDSIVPGKTANNVTYHELLFQIGDIIKISIGDRAPADMRAIEISGTCEFDTSSLTGTKSRKLRVDPLFSTDVYTESPNIIFLSDLCTGALATLTSLLYAC